MNMKKVASLRYDVIFKKAFGDPVIFTAFVRDLLGIKIEIDTVEQDKTYEPPIGSVATKFDLYAEDKKNSIIIEMQHVRYPDHYHRFLHYHCVALLSQIKKSSDYTSKLKVFTIVILTSGDHHKRDVSIIDFDPKDRKNKSLGEIDHKIIFLCPKYLQKDTPKAYRQWLEAIQDSLDEQIDESQYSIPEIQNVFQKIEEDKVTPIERAKMFQEYGEEALKQKGKEEGLVIGRAEGEKKGLAEGEKRGLAEGQLNTARALLEFLDDKTIAQKTKLTVAVIKKLRREK